MVTGREIWIAQGDERQETMAALMAADGNRVRRFRLTDGRIPDMEGADCVVLPLPGAGRELKGLFASLPPGALVCAGKVTEREYAQAAERGVVLKDYFAREELALLNAIPTAEGAIGIALEQMPVTLHGAQVLILGFGRLGQALGPRLRGLGSRVTAAARRPEQRALAESAGVEGVPFETAMEELWRFDAVVNTVPARVLGIEELAALREEAAVIDLASAPGGVDPQAAEALHVRLISAPGLPGRTAPVTAGRYLRDAVYHIMEEQGV